MHWQYPSLCPGVGNPQLLCTLFFFSAPHSATFCTPGLPDSIPDKQMLSLEKEVFAQNIRMWSFIKQRKESGVLGMQSDAGASDPPSLTVPEFRWSWNTRPRNLYDTCPHTHPSWRVNCTTQCLASRSAGGLSLSPENSLQSHLFFFAFKCKEKSNLLVSHMILANSKSGIAPGSLLLPPSPCCTHRVADTSSWPVNMVTPRPL